MNLYQLKLERIAKEVQEKYTDALCMCSQGTLTTSNPKHHQAHWEWNAIKHQLETEKLGRRKKDRLERRLKRCRSSLKFYESFHSMTNWVGGGIEGGDRAYAVFQAYIFALKHLRSLCVEFNVAIRGVECDQNLGEEIANKCNSILSNLEQHFPKNRREGWYLPTRKFEYSSRSDNSTKKFLRVVFPHGCRKRL